MQSVNDEITIEGLAIHVQRERDNSRDLCVTIYYYSTPSSRTNSLYFLYNNGSLCEYSTDTDRFSTYKILV